MIGSIKWLAPIVAVAIPVAAFAQGNDAAYCRALSAKYEAFLVNMQGHSEDAGNIEGRYAVEQCKQGNPAAAIPILERELNNNKITLPNRG